MSDTATKANDCGGASNGNVLTFSGSTGTIVYTQSNVLENVPITLTSPHIWEALGLPLTPFEDSINFFAEPGAVDEDTIRPFVAMKARLHDYDDAQARRKGRCGDGHQRPAGDRLRLGARSISRTASAAIRCPLSIRTPESRT